MLRLPRIEHRAASDGSTEIADASIELAGAVGLDLDEWQQYVLRAAMAEREPGRWAAFEFGLCVPRQNGKTFVIVARLLAGVFLLDEQLQVYSAHQFKTAMDTYNKLREVIDTSPDLLRRVKAMPDANGKEGIYLRGERRPRIMITARGKNAVRGFAADAVIYDETMELQETAVSAMLPTLARQPNAQVWYAGSAVDQMTMEHGEVFGRKRRQALAGESSRLTYLEYSMPGTIEAHDPYDAAGIRAANPSLELRPSWTLPDVDDERAGMSRRGFAVERLGIGDWPAEPEAVDTVIPQDVWRGLVAPEGSQITSPVAFAVDVAPDRKTAAIAVAGVTDDGHLQVEVVAHGRGVTWVPGLITTLVLAWDPLAVVVDKASGAASIIPTLQAEGIEVTATGAAEMGAACGGLYDDAEGGVLAHLDDPALNDALKDAGTRRCGDAWAFDRRGSSSIAPLVAVALARHGFVTSYAPPKRPGPGPIRETLPGNGHAATTDDLRTAGF